MANLIEDSQRWSEMRIRSVDAPRSHVFGAVQAWKCSPAAH